MNNFTETNNIKITDLIEKYKEYKDKNGKSLSYLYSKKLFDFVANIPENWSRSNAKLANAHKKPFNMESLPLENFRDLFRYVNVLFFNEIKKKLQSNKENSKTIKINFNDFKNNSNESEKSKIENYVSSVEIELRKILTSNIDDERNFKIAMIVSNDFSKLWNNEFNYFAKFNYLSRKYNIQRIEHDFLNKSNEFTIYKSVGFFWNKQKISSNLEKKIILLVITKKENDFRLKINNKIEFWLIRDPVRREWRGIGAKINFDTEITNLSKAKIFAITN